MMMKKYTEKDLKTFERDEDGYLICPSGDYTAVKMFPKKCSFGAGSSFGAFCRFGEWCSFGECCNFGEECSFGKWCGCGEWCNFGDGCKFGEWNSFGEWSDFGAQNVFGKLCSFGEKCSFGERCSHEGLTNSIYVAVDRIGTELRKTYFFKAKEGYFVRVGYFFGTLGEFKAKVHEKHRGTIHETTYLMACELAVKLLDSQWKK